MEQLCHSAHENKATKGGRMVISGRNREKADAGALPYTYVMHAFLCDRYALAGTFPMS
mgnify:CR=1 FL=1|jgi:hypothetical protein